MMFKEWKWSLQYPPFAKKTLSGPFVPGTLSGSMRQVRLGIIGGGTVGGGVVQALQRNGALMASRLGIELRLVKVAVRNPAKARAVKIRASLLTRDWSSVIADPEIDLIAELVGGTTMARSVVLGAFKHG